MEFYQRTKTRIDMKKRSDVIIGYLYGDRKNRMAWERAKMEIEKYANERVIEELEELIRDVDGYVSIVPKHLIKDRIKELKQE